MKYKSFVPPKISEYSFDSDKTVLAELSAEFARLDKCIIDLSDDQRTRLIKTEAHDSWLLSKDTPSNPFSFSLFQPNENSENLAHATDYAVEAVTELPISSRLIRNIHYIVCQSPDYDKNIVENTEHRLSGLVALMLCLQMLCSCLRWQRIWTLPLQILRITLTIRLKMYL